MINMDNKQWLLAMELFDDDYGITKGSKIVNDTIMNMKKISQEEQYKIRQIKALEIIAEGLCLLRKKPTVINNFNASK